MDKLTIIDGDSELRESLAFFFKQRKYKVTTYNKAVSAFYNHPQLRDESVILCDHSTDGMSGIDFIKSFRQQGHTTPIILMAEVHDIDLALEANKSGAFYYAVKPLALDQLALVVQKATQQLGHRPHQEIPLFVGSSPQILALAKQARPGKHQGAWKNGCP